MVEITPRLQLLGWLEHCEREHSGRATVIPTWLCSMSVLNEEIVRGMVTQIGVVPLVPKFEMTGAIYGLTEQGRIEFYAALAAPSLVPASALELKKEQRNGRTLNSVATVTPTEFSATHEA